MIRKIICPTDLSEVANNAVQYAAKLAQLYNAELLLVHIVPTMLGISTQGLAGIELQLNTRCSEIRKLFRISSDYELESGPGSLADHIAAAKQENAMVVMGTNGADTLYQRFFGANTYKVIRKTMCPVLVVPENVGYRSISKIVCASNYTDKESRSIGELYALTRILNVEYVFLHVNTYKPVPAAAAFGALKEDWKLHAGKNKAEFVQIAAANVPQGIDNYMTRSEADLLIITFFKRNLLRSFFSGGVTGKFINHVAYPILVLHA